jgi:hypothetical protein
MNMWADETLALSVTDATMQDWLAAAATIRDAPPTFFGARPAHPAVRRPAIERRTPAAGRSRSSYPKAAAAEANGVGGAPTAFWLVLVAALAVLAYV